MTLTRRDDLISLAYMMSYLYNGKLPFFDFGKQFSEQINNICNKKNECTPKQFCEENRCNFLLSFMENVYSLKFDEKPDYSFLRFLFEKNLMDQDEYPDQ